MLIGGHRGNPAEYPENTLASFRSALDLGLDFIECDVHLSRDGHLVVIHDETVDRTTDGSGAVAEMTCAELRRLDAGRGERIPLLSEVIDLCGDRAILAVEIKQPRRGYPEIEARLFEALDRAGMVRQSCVISFDWPTLDRVRALSSDLAVGLLELRPPHPELVAAAEAAATPIDPDLRQLIEHYRNPLATGSDPIAELARHRAEVYAPHWSGIDRAMVEAVHLAGGVIGVWTVDDPVASAWVKLAGPDFVFSNRPAEIIRLLRQ